MNLFLFGAGNLAEMGKLQWALGYSDVQCQTYLLVNICNSKCSGRPIRLTNASYPSYTVFWLTSTACDLFYINYFTQAEPRTMLQGFAKYTKQLSPNQ